MFKNKLKNYVCYNCKKFDDDLLRLPFNGFICHNCISNELDHLGVEKIKNDNKDLISIDDIINTKSFNYKNNDNYSSNDKINFEYDIVKQKLNNFYFDIQRSKEIINSKFDILY